VVPGIALLAFILSFGVLACAASGQAPRIVFDRTSSFGRVLVIDDGPRRVMRFGSPTASEQSAIEPANPRAVPVEYVRYALIGLAEHGQPRRVLMVGLGGGTFTSLVHRALPDATVDAVEIDPVVVAAARAHFGLREDARYRVHIADAAAWMGQAQGQGQGQRDDRYDFVLLDAYAGEEIPRALGTQAFFRAVARRLAPGGVVAINIAEMHAQGRAVAHAFAAVLTPFDCRRTPIDGNVLLFAADGPRPVDAAVMQRWLAAWDARGVTDFSLAALAAQRAPAPECDALGVRPTATAP
jgi:spermidine synthase